MKISPFRLRLLPIENGFGLETPDPEWLTCHQVHSADVFFCDSGHLNSIKADGLISSENKALAVQTADCLPVLFSTKDGKMVAAVHAGWRGVLDGILLNAVRKMSEAGAKPEDLLVAIGPCLRQCCFEISSSLVSEFESKWGGLWKKTAKPYSNTQPASNGAQAKPLQENIWMDLVTIARLQLLNCGVNQIDDLGVCTYCSGLASYRRATHENTGRAGRLWSFVRAAPAEPSKVQ